MYKLFAYSVVMNDEYSEFIPQIFKNRDEAKKFCSANNIPESNITQLYRFHHIKEEVPVVIEEPPAETQEPIEP